MKHEIDKHLDPELLQDNAFDVIYEEVRHDFSEEELIELKDEFFQISKMQDNRETALTRFKSALENNCNPTDIIEVIEALKRIDFGERGIKELKAQFKTKRKEIDRGYRIVEKQLFMFPYYEIERMAFFDDEGNYVYDRPMKPNENQLRIPSKIKSING